MINKILELLGVKRPKKKQYGNKRAIDGWIAVLDDGRDDSFGTSRFYAKEISISTWIRWEDHGYKWQRATLIVRPLKKAKTGEQ